MYRYLFRALGLVFFSLPEPVITNSIGAALILFSFLPPKEEILYASCGCDFHRYGWYQEDKEGIRGFRWKEEIKVVRYERGEILARRKAF